ncbi:hypothetical protein [Tropicibacter sp. S64]|uniref:hypothetical protein n=1 Tax=Tropicibacter sp. S64 TaxID=3415122 RepID=UPI003C7D108E
MTDSDVLIRDEVSLCLLPLVDGQVFAPLEGLAYSASSRFRTGRAGSGRLL